ncbi:MAG: hypothetical protein MJ252_00530 [archaeon]|nr:hypothetical protein [archaeon]
MQTKEENKKKKLKSKKNGEKQKDKEQKETEMIIEAEKEESKKGRIIFSTINTEKDPKNEEGKMLGHKHQRNIFKVTEPKKEIKKESSVSKKESSNSSENNLHLMEMSRIKVKRIKKEPIDIPQCK